MRNPKTDSVIRGHERSRSRTAAVDAPEVGPHTTRYGSGTAAAALRGTAPARAKSNRDGPRTEREGRRVEMRWRRRGVVATLGSVMGRAHLFACLAVAAVPGVAVADEDPAKTCISSWGEARFGGVGFNHVVHVANKCAASATCAVSTDVEPTPQSKSPYRAKRRSKSSRTSGRLPRSSRHRLLRDEPVGRGGRSASTVTTSTANRPATTRCAPPSRGAR